MNQRQRPAAVPPAAPAHSDVAIGRPRPAVAEAYGVPVASTVYVTGVEPGSSRATVALGVAELLSRRVRRLGAFRPLVRTDPDPMLDLLRTRYHLAAVGFGATYTEAIELIAAGRVNDLVERIVDAFRIVDEQADAAVVIGTDFGRDGGDTRDGNGLADELALNARLATEMHATVLPVIDAHGRDAAAVAASIRTAFHTLVDLHTTQVAVIANRVDESTGNAAVASVGDLDGVPVFAIPDVAAVSAPTVAEVSDALHATRLLGGAEAYARDVLSVVVGGATVPTFLDHLRDGALVIAPGDRADLIVAAYSVHVAGQVTLAGIMLTLGIEPDKRVLALVDRLGGNLPVCVVASDTFDTVARVAAVEGRLSVDNSRKVDAALGAFESSVDTAQLARRLDIARSVRVTPLMFEYELISRARALRRHVVLPEGTEERILRATEILLRRGVCDADPARSRRRHPAPHPRTRPDPRRRGRDRSGDIAVARRVRRRVRHHARGQGRHHRGGPRPARRSELFRHHDGPPRLRRRDGVRRRPPDRRHHPARVRNHQDRARAVRSVIGLFHVPGRPGARLRRLRDQPRSRPGATGRHRHLLGRRPRPRSASNRG